MWTWKTRFLTLAFINLRLITTLKYNCFAWEELWKYWYLKGSKFVNTSQRGSENDINLCLKVHYLWRSLQIKTFEVQFRFFKKWLFPSNNKDNWRNNALLVYEKLTFRNNRVIAYETNMKARKLRVLWIRFGWI